MEATDKILSTVAKQVFESVAYVSLRPEEDEVGVDLRGDMVKAAVAFKGPFNGQLQIEVPRSLLPELACNMLGEDEDSPGINAQGMDALGELTNIICGNLLERLAGPGPIFNLGAPKIQSIVYSARVATEAKPKAQAKIFLETGWAVLALFVDGA